MNYILNTSNFSFYSRNALLIINCIRLQWSSILSLLDIRHSVSVNLVGCWIWCHQHTNNWNHLGLRDWVLILALFFDYLLECFFKYLLIKLYIFVLIGYHLFRNFQCLLFIGELILSNNLVPSLINILSHEHRINNMSKVHIVFVHNISLAAATHFYYILYKLIIS